MQVRKARGFTLIELMVVVAIIAVLSVLAIFGVARYLKTSKSVEAENNVGQIAKAASESLNRDKGAGTYAAPGATTTVGHCICASATASVPTTIASVQSKKYSSDPVNDWRQGASMGSEDLVGWRCLKFSVDQPQYYQYTYTESAASCTSNTIANDDVHALAHGDLDGNGVQSTFDLEGKVASGESQLTWAPKPLETQPEE